MPFRNIKPLHILWQQDIEKEMLRGVFLGIARVLLIAKIFQQFKLEHLGQQRHPYWRSQAGALNPNQSLDWHIELARKNSKRVGYLNSVALLNSLEDNPKHKTQLRYMLTVVNEPLHWSDTSLRTVGGIGRKEQGAVITLANHLHLLQPVAGENDEDKQKRRVHFWLSTQMLAMHELGHVFGLFIGTGGKDPTDQELKNAHCLNECVMYWREEDDLYKKIMGRPFCPSCLEKVKQFFIAP